MKKILFLLLSTISMYAQVPADATPLENIQITNNVQDNTATRVGVQTNQGVLNWNTLKTVTGNSLLGSGDINPSTSTAVTSIATLTNNGTTFTLSALTGRIVNNTTVPATITNINFPGASNVTPLYARTILYIDPSGTLVQFNGGTSDLTSLQKRENIFIGIVVYSGGVVLVTQMTPSIDYSVDNRFGDLTDFLRNINEGNNIGPNGANLQINKGAGYTFRRGSNYANNRNSPDVTFDIAATPVPSGINLIGYRNGSGGWTYELYSGITPTFWDNGSGTKQTVANNKFTNPEVYFFNGTDTYIIYLGRQEHATLNDAKLAAEKVVTIKDPGTSPASLIGTISVVKECTALNNTAEAFFTQGPRMQGGASGGGTSGSLSLQNIYNNSVSPQITTSTALGSLDIKNGGASDSVSTLRVQNIAGASTFSVSGAGGVVGNTWNGYTPESTSNKATDFSVVDNVKYPSVQAVKTYADAGFATKANLSGAIFTGSVKAPNISNIDAINIDIVGLGDSITKGLGSTGGNTSWFDKLQTLLGFKTATKLAVTGSTAMPTVGRAELFDQTIAVPVGTDLITLMIGVNDYTAGNALGSVSAVIAKSYASLDKTLSFTEAFRYNLEYLKVNFPNAKIIVITPTPISAGWPGTFNLKRYIDAEIAIANYLGVPVIDAQKFSGLYKTTTFTVDGLHPNDAGYDLLTEFVLNGMLSPNTAYGNLEEVVTQKLEVSGTAKFSSVMGSAYSAETGSDSNYAFFRSNASGLGTLVYDVAGNPVIIQPNSGNTIIGTFTNDGVNKFQVNGSGKFTGTVTASPATVSTELVTKGQLDAAVPPYLVYTALLSQSGSGDPVATVLKNTLGGTVVWTRSSTGIYLATLSGAFTTNKTFIQMNTGHAINGFEGAAWIDSSNVQVSTYLNGPTYSDGRLANNGSSIEIRVYP